MQSILTRALCQMSIFMICIQTLIHFRPNDSYEKYLKLLVSVMLLVQIFQPFCQMLSLGSGEDLTRRILFYQESLEEQMDQALQHTSMEMTLEELSRQELERRMLEEQQNQTEEAEEVQKGETVQQSQQEDISVQDNITVSVEPVEVMVEKEE